MFGRIPLIVFGKNSLKLNSLVNCIDRGRNRGRTVLSRWSHLGLHHSANNLQSRYGLLQDFQVIIHFRTPVDVIQTERKSIAVSAGMLSIKKCSRAKAVTSGEKTWQKGANQVSQKLP